MRALFDLSRVLFLLPLAGFVVGLLIAAGIALWRRHFRRVASSIFAIAVIPVGFVVVAKVPFFDPWFWYAMANRARFEAFVASGPPSNGSKYAVVEGRDVSTGLAGLRLIILCSLYTMRAMLSVVSRLNGQAFGGPER